MAGFYARPPSGANRHVHMTSADPVLSRNGSCVVRHSKCGAPHNRAISSRNWGSRQIRRMRAVPDGGRNFCAAANGRQYQNPTLRMWPPSPIGHQFRNHLVGSEEIAALTKRAKTVLPYSIPLLGEGVLRRAYQPSSGLFEAPQKSRRSTNRIAACHSLQ